MKNFEEKFLVINKKRFQEMNEAWSRNYPWENHPAVEKFMKALEELNTAYTSCTNKEMNQKYIICNQDEPYAEEVKKIILSDNTSYPHEFDTVRDEIKHDLLEIRDEIEDIRKEYSIHAHRGGADRGEDERVMIDEIEKAFQILALYGVPRDRAHTIDNGISVLVTRLDREIDAIKANAKSDRALLEEAVEAITNYMEWGAKTSSDRDLLESNFSRFLARAKEVLK